jgi:signal transduction histidine kinase
MHSASSKGEQLAENLDLGDVFRGCLVSAIFKVDATRRITLFSEAAERILQMKASQALNSRAEVLPGPLLALVEETFQKAQPVEARQLSLEGEPCQSNQLLANSMPHLTREGHVGAVLVWFHDLSSLGKVEITMRRLDRLAQTGVLAASAAHEIKNALVAIKTFIEVLLERNEEMELSNLVSHEIQRIDSILSQLLKFTGPAAAIMTPLRLHEVLENSIRLIHHKLTTHHIKLTRSFQAPRDKVKGDEKQLRQAFINLFLNAIEAMRLKGSLHVSTQLEPESQESVSNGSCITLTISDSGAGIAPENLPHLYEPFFTTKADGTGLGLAITRRIVHEHGGTITATSELNRGTTFRISIPLA